MNRTPPSNVRKMLRSEVGFGCPVHDCGNPYLYWHHFDPPWKAKQHHDPEGMVAMCAEHHDKADAGAYTRDQLRAFKRSGVKRAAAIKGRFDWMRHEFLIVAGGNFFYRTPIIFQFRNEPIIWLNRDEEGYLTLNVRMLTTSKEPRTRLEDNFWFSRGEPEDIESPPSGKLLYVKYKNGDMLRVRFRELKSVAAVLKHYPGTSHETWDISYPVTAVEVHASVGGTNIAFSPRKTTFGGATITGNFVSGCKVGISIQ